MELQSSPEVLVEKMVIMITYRFLRTVIRLQSL